MSKPLAKRSDVEDSVGETTQENEVPIAGPRIQKLDSDLLAEMQARAAGPAVSGGAPANPDHRIDMKYLVRALVKYNASDLHIKVGRPPLYRINGKLIPAKMPELTQEQTQKILFSVLTSRQIRELEERRHIDLSFGVKGLGRFRCNVYYQQGMVASAIRMIPLAIPSLEQLGLPPVLKELCLRPRGLILVTGSTGSGKSTTLAAMIQHINQTRNVHILSIEDPIEFLHRDLKATVTQREVGSDTHSLQDALFAGLRQDPDIIMISEMRSFETIQTALTAAETGHLVLSTLHTNDARGTIDRIVDVFPTDAREQVRIQFASALVAIVSQQLVLRSDAAGRVAACEVMIKSPTIEGCILKNDLEKIPDVMAQSSDYYKMQTMNMALERLVERRIVTLEEALKCSGNPSDLKLRVSGLSRDKGYDIEDEGVTFATEIREGEEPEDDDTGTGQRGPFSR